MAPRSYVIVECNGYLYRCNCKHLRKDQANTIILCQQEVNWEESDSDEGEETGSNIASSSEPINTTDSRPQNADRFPMMPSIYVVTRQSQPSELPPLAAS